MGRSVTITTPIPTLEEVGKSLKMSKARQRRLIEIVRGNGTHGVSERRRDASGSVNGRTRDRNGNAKVSASRNVALSKTSKHADAV